MGPLPVPAYAVLGRGPRRSPLATQGAWPLHRFVGRERELATLQALLTHVEAGKGQVVGIVGEPGMGKSRLVYESAEAWTTDHSSPLPAIHSLVGDLTPSDAGLCQVWHARGILTVGILHPVTPLILLSALRGCLPDPA